MNLCSLKILHNVKFVDQVLDLLVDLRGERTISNGGFLNVFLERLAETSVCAIFEGSYQDEDDVAREHQQQLRCSWNYKRHVHSGGCEEQGYSPKTKGPKKSSGRHNICHEKAEIAAHTIPNNVLDDMLNSSCGDGWHTECIDNSFADNHSDGDVVYCVAERDNCHGGSAIEGSLVYLHCLRHS